MKRSTNPRLTRNRRRALAVPFVITIAATGAACGANSADAPIGDRPETTDEVISNPAEPEPALVETISYPAEPETETEAEREVMISNPAEPEPEPEPEPDATIVTSNPASPEDG